mgnify:CR=1
MNKVVALNARANRVVPAQPPAAVSRVRGPSYLTKRGEGGKPASR